MPIGRKRLIDLSPRDLHSGAVAVTMRPTTRYYAKETGFSSGNSSCEFRRVRRKKKKTNRYLTFANILFWKLSFSRGDPTRVQKKGQQIRRRSLSWSDKSYV